MNHTHQKHNQNPKNHTPQTTQKNTNPHQQPFLKLVLWRKCERGKMREKFKEQKRRERKGLRGEEGQTIISESNKQTNKQGRENEVDTHTKRRENGP